LDLFIEAMKSIAEEVEEDPQYVLDARTTPASPAGRNRRRKKARPALEAGSLARLGMGSLASVGTGALASLP